MSSLAWMVVRNADLGGQQADVWWRDGIVRYLDRPERHRRDRPTATETIDVGGCGLLPGLHDHHIHLLATAAANASVRVGPPEVNTVDQLQAVLAAACRRSTSVRAVGYHESVAGDLDSARLDDLVPEAAGVPIRVQQRTGQLWVLNGAAARAVDLWNWTGAGIERDAGGHPTGRLLGRDADLRRLLPSSEPDLAALGRELASYGVTGVTDLTPTEDAAEVEFLARAACDPSFPIRVTLTGGLGLSASAGAGLPRGPVKLLPADHALVDPDQLASDIRRAHDLGRSVAIHCVTRVGLVVVLAAFEDAGVIGGDRIEHGAIIPDDFDDHLRRLGLTVITQPVFIAERGDQYLDEVDADDQPFLWRCRSLLDGGIPTAFGTDAPFGHPDPWRSIVAAASRQSPSGRRVGPAEGIGHQAALDLFLGSAGQPTTARQIAVGARTDLCLLRTTIADARHEPTAGNVRATLGRAGLTTG